MVSLSAADITTISPGVFCPQDHEGGHPHPNPLSALVVLLQAARFLYNTALILLEMLYHLKLTNTNPLCKDKVYIPQYTSFLNFDEAIFFMTLHSVMACYVKQGTAVFPQLSNPFGTKTCSDNQSRIVYILMPCLITLIECTPLAKYSNTTVISAVWITDCGLRG